MLLAQIGLPLPRAINASDGLGNWRRLARDQVAIVFRELLLTLTASGVFELGPAASHGARIAFAVRAALPSGSADRSSRSAFRVTACDGTHSRAVAQFQRQWLPTRKAVTVGRVPVRPGIAGC
jgi:hypothetical protein